MKWKFEKRKNVFAPFVGAAQGKALAALLLAVVVFINAGALAEGGGKLTLPEGLKVIQSQAFASIGASHIVIPGSVQEIADDAFDGLENLTATVKPGSYAQLYCERKGIPWPIILGLGASLKLDPMPGSGDVAWNSSSPDVAAVDENGRITGYSKGHAVITCVDGDSDMQVRVEVVDYRETVRPLSIAHRGASGYCPDNSLEAFQKAHELNADGVELDVRKTKDGVLVLFHDTKIKIGDSKKKISDITYATLLKKAPHLCTFMDAMEYIAKTDMQVMIEVKEGGFAADILNCVQECGMEDRVFYGSFSIDNIRQIKALNPNARIGYTFKTTDIGKDYQTGRRL